MCLKHKVPQFKTRREATKSHTSHGNFEARLSNPGAVWLPVRSDCNFSRGNAQTAEPQHGVGRSKRCRRSARAPAGAAGGRGRPRGARGEDGTHQGQCSRECRAPRGARPTPAKSTQSHGHGCRHSHLILKVVLKSYFGQGITNRVQYTPRFLLQHQKSKVNKKNFFKPTIFYFIINDRLPLKIMNTSE